MQCSAAYIFPRIEQNGVPIDRSWILSAGHCSKASEAVRNHELSIIGGVAWRAVVENHDPLLGPDVDLALGSVPDTRELKRWYWLESKAPDAGVVYIHGFPLGVERVSAAHLIPASLTNRLIVLERSYWYGDVPHKFDDKFKGTRVVLVPRGEQNQGSSGAPILNEYGRIIGVLWGMVPSGSWTTSSENPDSKAEEKNYDLFMFTPVERLHELFKYMGVKYP